MVDSNYLNWERVKIMIKLYQLFGHIDNVKWFVARTRFENHRHDGDQTGDKCRRTTTRNSIEILLAISDLIRVTETQPINIICVCLGNIKDFVNPRATIAIVHACPTKKYNPKIVIKEDLAWLKGLKPNFLHSWSSVNESPIRRNMPTFDIYWREKKKATISAFRCGPGDP